MKSVLKNSFAALAAAFALAACSDIMGDLKAPESPAPTPTPTPPGPDYSIPLTIEAEAAGAVVTFDNKAEGPVTYKVNGGEAQTIANGDSKAITLDKAGDKVEFFGDNQAYATISENSHIACDAACYVYGNIMSLIKSEGFKDAKTLEKEYALSSLFSKNNHIKNKEGADLLLPAETLTESCYEKMFFRCTSLTTAPALPATTLATSCYDRMFRDCSKITASPNLPAATLAQSCYDSMFRGCVNLTSVTCLATDISAEYCAADWLRDVAASGTFTKAEGMTSWPRNRSGIPSGWTYNKDDPLTIPLTIEAETNGAVVTFDNKATGAVTYKVNGGPVQTIASGAPESITLESTGDKVEFFGDNQAYATSDSNYSNITCSKDCYVYGNIMSLVKRSNFESATTLEASYTFVNLFKNNSHIKNKDGANLLLPATTLAAYCYYGMFNGCENLSSVTCLATDISAENCTVDWLKGVSSTGTFTKASSMNDWTTGENGIPSGWTVVEKQ